ncbi:hypothetical protein [Nocardia fluminea]|uniref:hypothetical protein n=1 Tax=Nocardia fluminea TaxID=134984 RepID=UPI0033F8AB35
MEKALRVVPHPLDSDWRAAVVGALTVTIIVLVRGAGAGESAPAAYADAEVRIHRERRL